MQPLKVGYKFGWFLPNSLSGKFFFFFFFYNLPGMRVAMVSSLMKDLAFSGTYLDFFASLAF